MLYIFRIVFQGCAIAVGYCGSAHLDTVLVKLEKVAKDKKNTGWLGQIKVS